MELLAYLVEIFPTIGFPIICCGVLGWFIYRFYIDSQKQNKENMEQVQARCQEREDKLYDFIVKQEATNQQFADLIQRYEFKLDSIQGDVKAIKEDIIEIKAKQ